MTENELLACHCFSIKTQNCTILQCLHHVSLYKASQILTEVLQRIDEHLHKERLCEIFGKPEATVYQLCNMSIYISPVIVCERNSQTDNASVTATKKIK